MIRIKHLLEAVEADDGRRIWVEPIGLTKDFQQWCRIDHVMPHLGPPVELWRWLEEHPDGYDFFRARYHEYLSKGAYKPALRQLAWAGSRENFTLIHQSDDDQHNTATALYEYLGELSALCPPET